MSWEPTYMEENKVGLAWHGVAQTLAELLLREQGESKDTDLSKGAENERLRLV